MIGDRGRSFLIWSSDGDVVWYGEALDEAVVFGDVETSRLVTLRRRDWCFGIKINCSGIVLVPL